MPQIAVSPGHVTKDGIEEVESSASQKKYIMDLLNYPNRSAQRASTIKNNRKMRL